MTNFYIDTNEFDAYRAAANSTEAVKQVFPKAQKLRSIGWEDDKEIFSVIDEDGRDYDVLVEERK